ncbi:BirA family biotin operon repressor/biotin-[acetyl-CoA-carboxylase] ligase [Arthrobacter stackebrandtii]|uniref:biotin--[biotin carboxyl-carrier protein] ligase n=1 Tax=Arthrobacter stackebrandtii TaxID=272161 RepID=A0ABS4YRP2_9MICC|nr:biotin--[acetyl-CoA-carboxylase] ligase [Arthrobacter stackebrandtii]MBP2411456.1 BirA family biotin operon repressor/biotin-[acetyl-CoA-carboxylase] ligase [Arthrobacter stackebrandtii]PYH00265.1 biotin--[acetyl-CoA-carboxylase] ligase [Arthrobacter stackebrandtii]
MTGAAPSPDPSGLTQPQNPAPVQDIALDAAGLKSALLHPVGRFGRVEVVDSAGSTNTDLAAAAADPQQFWPDLSVLIADAQPAGKGRLGRPWEVPAGAAMISSILVWPGGQNSDGGQAAAGAAPESGGSARQFAPSGYGWLSILAGVALCETLHALTGVQAELKWPNDVVVGGRKLAGILAQVVPARPAQPATAGATQPRGNPGHTAQAVFGVVIGAGVNVSLTAEQLPTERATSLLLEGAATLDRNRLLPAYLNNFAAHFKAFGRAGGDAEAPLDGERSVLELAAAHMSTLGQEVRAELPGGTMLHGTAVGLGADGGLDIRDAAGRIHHVSAGDVIHLRRTSADGSVKYA